MTSLSIRALSPIYPVAGLLLAGVHLGLELAQGGVKTHYFRGPLDLPGMSNWFALLILPALGLLLAWRVRAVPRGSMLGPLPSSIAVPLLAACAYGVVIAVSFHFGVSAIAQAAFMGLFVCALVLPVYRAEYVSGFTLGMTFTFGSVIPLCFALVFATLSFLVRGAARLLIAALRRPTV